jgi:periplasmic divalent cation tolerance protein
MAASDGDMAASDGDYLQVQTTVEREEDARVLADALVAERLAACAQIVGPIESVYWWQGSITGGREWMVLLKTTGARYAALEHRLRELHPYERPEIMAVAIGPADPEYLSWIEASLLGS